MGNDQPPKVAAIVERFQAEHPTATRVKVTVVTRKAVYIRYCRNDLDALGLYVGWFKKEN